MIKVAKSVARSCAKSVSIGALLKQNSVHKWVEETLARVLSRDTVYSGKIVYVDASKADDTGNGLTPETARKTIANAYYDLCSNGDIIQLADGVYNTALESNNYILLNKAGIGVKIRGNAADKTSVKIYLGTSGPSYSTRIRECGECRFENITFETNQNIATVYNSNIYANLYLKFYRCKFVNTNGGSAANLYKTDETITDTAARFTEFEECEFIKPTVGEVFKSQTQGINTIIFYKNCTFTGGGVWYETMNRGSLIMYDNQINMASSILAVLIGTDTAIPTTTAKMFDFRGNTISYATGFGQHALLLGRGQKNAYIVNNDIRMDYADTSLRIGIVVKSIPDNFADVKILGNYLQCTRPIYIKGGSNNQVLYNTGVTEQPNYAPFTIIHAQENVLLISENNEIKHNKFYGNNMCLSEAGTDGTTLPLSENNNTIDNNVYYSESDYIYKKYLSKVSWTDRADYWGESENDANSKFLSSSPLPITVDSV